MVKQLGVVGFGAMGSEIGLLAACAGIDVVAYDSFLTDREKAIKRLVLTLKRMKRDENFFVAAEIAEDAGRDAIIQRISFADDVSGLAACEVVVEAAPEKLEIKQALFLEVAGHVSEDTILASNTSSISISAIAASVPNPARVVGLHFFNPPVIMNLVEVIPGLQTSAEVVDRTCLFAETLGKKTIRVKETPGFVVNRILLALMVEAMVLAQEGIASFEDIDEAMRMGTGMPMGPFKLADFVGLDVVEHSLESIYQERGDAKFRPPFLLKQHVRAGRLGRKTRHGFYKY